MIVVQIVVMALVGLLGLATVRTSNPLSQLIVFSLFGAALSVLFLVLQAPDVALSEIVVGAVAYPLMVLLALGKVRNREGVRGAAAQRSVSGADQAAASPRRKRSAGGGSLTIQNR